MKKWEKSVILDNFTQNMRLTLVNFCYNLLNCCTKPPICAIFSLYFEKNMHFLLPKKGRFRVVNGHNKFVND